MPFWFATVVACERMVVVGVADDSIDNKLSNLDAQQSIKSVR